MFQKTLNNLKKVWDKVMIFFSGMFMSISDIVPGFSGGIALAITGALQRVWSTQEKIVHPKQKGDRLKGILFYVVFVTGSLVGVFGFSHVIKLLLDKQATVTFWFFITLSICSLFIFASFNHIDVKDVSINHDKRKRTTHKTRVLGLFFGFALIITICATVFFLRGPQTISDLRIEPGNTRIDNPSTYIVMYIAGFLAAAAMVTPGVSGALVILLFGVYGDIYGDLYVHPFDHIVILIIYMVVGVLGTITSMTILDKLYKKHTLFMKWFFFGAISASVVGMVWMFHEMFIPAISTDWILIVAAVILAIALSWGVIKLRKKMDSKETKAAEEGK